MTRRILLVGYYGKGNFGDDVLLTVSYRLLRAKYPAARIAVIVDGAHGAYVQRLLGDVEILSPGRHGRVDLIVHGGGGVFFDFKRYGLAPQLLEAALKVIGFHTYLAFEACLRAMVGKRRTSAPVRVGMGIGVGTYTAGSSRLRERLPILADFKALWVRDGESVRNLARFKKILRGEIVEGSDLAFLTQHWLGDVPTRSAHSGKPKLGICLRDWPTEQGGMPVQELCALFHSLSARYEISGFIFDEAADPELRQALSEYVTHVWQPETMSLEGFAAMLAEQDVLLVSRAHAAICGACVGVPSVIIEIEPKLAQVARMLPHASRLVAANTPQQWASAVEEALNIPSATIAADVAMNRALSAAAYARIERYLP